MNLSADDQEFVKFARGAHYKQCPKCRFWVSKNEGCDHMTCRCKYEFCYKCGGPYGSCGCEEDYSDYGSDYSGPDIDLEMEPSDEEPDIFNS